MFQPTRSGRACRRLIRTSVTMPVLRSAPRLAIDSLNQVSESQFARFAARAGLPGDASLRQVVNAVQAIPYGRPFIAALTRASQLAAPT
jgi:hypothetical protein